MHKHSMVTLGAQHSHHIKQHDTYAGHLGKVLPPFPLGDPVAAKLVQYSATCSHTTQDRCVVISASSTATVRYHNIRWHRG